ncbi:hypothetical protein [cf. Phormidesmis sp. LEGE 11477]|uniref:hypothetical protein n=1 Tax=cf. Phormidesmis sp. LEGE 11477 TaxID=1828680 RepID=UPI001882E8B3|nr:hypothetical protein [cf. Phormidesmis sp. LEGE 11477]MBE9064953.1 hypothetical protein [cf. Phormidesmis sp. LEGE 11477]
MATSRAQNPNSSTKKGSINTDHPTVRPNHNDIKMTIVEATRKSAKDRATAAVGMVSLRTAIFFRSGPFIMMHVPDRATAPEKKIQGTRHRCKHRIRLPVTRNAEKRADGNKVGEGRLPNREWPTAAL